MALGIREKLFGGFGVVLALVLVIGFIGLRNKTAFAAQFKTLYHDRLESVVRLGAVEQGLYELRLGAAGATYAASKPEDRAAMKARDEIWLTQIDDNMGAYQLSTITDDEKTALQEWESTFAEFKKIRLQIIDLVDQGDASSAITVRADAYTQSTARATDIITRLLTLQENVGSRMNQDTASMAGTSVNFLLFAMAAALVVGLTVAFAISRGVARGVKEVQRVLTSIAENDAMSIEHGLTAMSNGDLTVEARSVTRPIEKLGGDEIGQTASVTNALLARLQTTTASYERAREGLGGVVGQVRRAAAQVADNSAQLDSVVNQTGSAV